MPTVLTISKALSDETRIRALLALREGELCLCQLIELFGLAPSTMSKHLDLLYRAGLVQRRKEGRWHYFRLADRSAPVTVRQALRWVITNLADDPAGKLDAKRLRSVRKVARAELSACCYGPQ